MALSRIHSRLLPKMGKYAGIDLPLTFSKFNIKDVVINTRRPDFTTVFDVSHMGVYEANIQNNISEKLEKLLKTDVRGLKPNKAKLAVILNENGEVQDDLIISNVDNKKYRLVVNAGKNTTTFFDNFSSSLKRNEKSIIALQGDGSQRLLENIINEPLDSLYFMENKVLLDEKFEICRCGYTGEDGFELYLNNIEAEKIYEHLVSLAEQHEQSNTKVIFGGLIERDVLRTEAGLSLSGVEFSKDLEINFNSLNMPFLIDKKYRSSLSQSSFYQTLLSSDMPIKRGVIYGDSSQIDNCDENSVGFITSTVKSFNLNKFIGIGYINKNAAHHDMEEIPIFIKDRRNKRNYLKMHKNLINNKYFRKHNLKIK